MGTTCDMKGKIVLVTGANRGIGKAIVDTSIEYGATKIYAGVRDLKTATPLVEAHGEKIIPIQMDLENPNSIQAAAKIAHDVQIAINNAGVLKAANPLSENAFETLNYEMNINVGGLLRMAQAFAPVLETNGGGAFVQLNSVASLKSFPEFSTYCASKAAAYSITQALRVLFAEQGTAVVSVHPGPIATDMANEAGLGEMAEPPSLVADAIIQALKSGSFHAFPDTMAKQVWSAYQGFAETIVEAEMQED